MAAPEVRERSMLEQALQQILPGARLEQTTLPGLPLRLELLAPDYPQDALSP